MATTTLVVIGSVTAREYLPVLQEMRNLDRGPRVVRVSDEQLDQFIRTYLHIESEMTDMDTHGRPYGEDSYLAAIRAAIIGHMGIRHPFGVDRIVMSIHAYTRLSSILIKLPDHLNRREQVEDGVRLLDMIELIFDHCRRMYVVQYGRPQPLNHTTLSLT